MTRDRKILLVSELAVVFLAMPLLINRRVLPNWPIPFLLLVTLGAFLILRQEPAFDGAILIRFRGVMNRIRPLLLRDGALIAVLGVAVWRMTPELLFSFVKTNPMLWAVVMVLYPVLSVYPQEFLFRAYFFAVRALVRRRMGNGRGKRSGLRFCAYHLWKLAVGGA
jgi:uncharacterized protein